MKSNEIFTKKFTEDDLMVLLCYGVECLDEFNNITNKIYKALDFIARSTPVATTTDENTDSANDAVKYFIRCVTEYKNCFIHCTDTWTDDFAGSVLNAVIAAPKKEIYKFTCTGYKTIFKRWYLSTLEKKLFSRESDLDKKTLEFCLKYITVATKTLNNNASIRSNYCLEDRIDYAVGIYVQALEIAKEANPDFIDNKTMCRAHELLNIAIHNKKCDSYNFGKLVG